MSHITLLAHSYPSHIHMCADSAARKSVLARMNAPYHTHAWTEPRAQAQTHIHNLRHTTTSNRDMIPQLLTWRWHANIDSCLLPPLRNYYSTISPSQTKIPARRKSEVASIVPKVDHPNPAQHWGDNQSPPLATYLIVHERGWGGIAWWYVCQYYVKLLEAICRHVSEHIFPNSHRQIEAYTVNCLQPTREGTV